MFSRFFTNHGKINRIGFESMKEFLEMRSSSSRILVNTLSLSEQSCLIQDTISASKEESMINDFLNDYDTSVSIVVYGKNAHDIRPQEKCTQFVDLGFQNVYWYVGGLFEWLLLQEIYGNAEFPTTQLCKDILMYR